MATALLFSEAAAAAVNPNNVVEIFKEVSGSLKSGDADNKLTAHFASSINLRILATEKTCSARQAAAAVKEFFLQYKPTNFTMLHVGSKANKHYSIGLLATGGGRFRVTVFLLINAADSYDIQQLCIDYED
ncbi:MAG: DUF4783 domain-containing protein [Prevotellaceae bacterium]|nr:DUF4783 domain-containing protein [Prevotellaceae bacterium]